MSTRIASRVAASVLGGWAFTWGFVSLAIAGLVALGVRYGEAHTGVMLAAFLIYLGVFLWSFAAASVVRVWAVLAGGAAAMTGAAWLVQRTLL